MGKKELILEKETEISRLEEKISHLKNTIETYHIKLKKYFGLQLENEIFRDMVSVFSSSETPGDFYKGIITLLVDCLKARYGGIFLLDHERDSFIYRSGQGYKPGLMPGVPRIGSLMGECLHQKEILLEPDLASKNDYIALNQEPPEQNVLFVPLFISGDEFGVLRFANFDPEVWNETGKNILETVMPLFCTTLERLQEGNRNRQSMKGLKAAFTIARQLENTLEIKDILKNICLHIPKIFDCRACVIALVNKDSLKPVMSWPTGYHFSGNPQSGIIYLRNLLEAYPNGEALIKDIRWDKRWTWPKMDIGSICMAGLYEQKTLRGIIVAASTRHERYSSTEQNLLGLVAAQTSVTMERASYFRKQEELAARDGLTGLLNHRIFQERIRLEIERAKRYKRLLSLVMFDIDHFKRVNDRHGHPVGDKVLKMVASCTRKMVRSSDMAFRYGGEEFCVLLPETAPDKAVVFAERLRKNIESTRTVKKLAVTISLGISGYQVKDEPQDLIDRADAALYMSKAGGRNRVTVG